MLADFPNIADWNDGIKKSYSTGEAVEGVGAMRHCELAPIAAVEETVRESTPNERMVVSIDSAKKVPIKRGRMTFTLGNGTDSTPFEMSYDYEAKGGPFAFLVAKMLNGQLRKGFTGFIHQLEPAAQQRTASS
ncbi:MAG: SRPBCC family protein [Actinomycetota bacterium]|nr:SRPBCC family protein [Actinomycetota bacterium]